MLLVKWLVNWWWRYMRGELVQLSHPLFKICSPGGHKGRLFAKIDMSSIKELFWSNTDMETWPGPGFGILVPLKSCGLPTSSLLSPMWTRWTTHCQLPPQGGQGPGPRLFERLLRLAGTGSGYQIGKHGTTNGQVLIFKFFSSQSPIMIDQDVLKFGHWSTYSW